jgi:hypothetical protein
MAIIHNIQAFTSRKPARSTSLVVGSETQKHPQQQQQQQWIYVCKENSFSFLKVEPKHVNLNTPIFTKQHGPPSSSSQAGYKGALQATSESSERSSSLQQHHHHHHHHHLPRPQSSGTTSLYSMSLSNIESAVARRRRFIWPLSYKKKRTTIAQMQGPIIDSVQEQVHMLMGAHKQKDDADSSTPPLLDTPHSIPSSRSGLEKDERHNKLSSSTTFTRSHATTTNHNKVSRTQLGII